MKQIVPAFGVSLVIGFISLISYSDATAQYSDGPFLRLHSWMHTAGITQISLDGPGRYLASSSYDRTVRLWDIKSRRLVTTFRPPIGHDKEGILLSVAITKDGRTIVTGGHTAAGGDTNSLYVFDVRSRALVKRLPGHKDAIYFMTFSPDGKFLAVLMGSAGGLRVYRTESWDIVRDDLQYADRSYWAAFDTLGRLATTSMDGFVRAYDQKFALIKKVQIAHHNEPFGVSFSPDGKSIAVGFTDSKEVRVISFPDLVEQVVPDTHDVSGGTLAVVTWSLDGKHLYGAGEYRKSGKWTIRLWPDGGKGTPRDIPVGSNTITDLRPMPSGGVAFATLDPLIGFTDSLGRSTYVQADTTKEKTSQVDFRNSQKYFLVSETGDMVRFSYDTSGKQIGQFSVSDRTLTIPSGQTVGLKSTDESSLPVHRWKDMESPEFAGRPLEVERHERSRSLSVSPAHDFFVLGTERHIYYFNNRGQQKWKIRTESIAWSINVSGNSKVVVAALSDGTIHWYRTDDGYELLTLFVLPDRQRWIIWTSEWYYDAAQGAENLIGWHINRGWDAAAEFFPIQLFRDTYFRPDLVDQTLHKGHGLSELRDADGFILGQKASPLATSYALTKTPPIVRILTPVADREVAVRDIVIKVGVRSPLPIVSWHASIDGRPIETGPPIKDESESSNEQEVWRFVIRLPERDCSIGLIASHKYFESVPASVPVKWIGSVNGVKGNLNILAVGVSKYANTSITNLGYADKDANDLVKAFMPQSGLLYSRVNERLLRNKRATHDNIVRGLKWLSDTTTKDDVAIIFLAGHGFSDKRDTYYFLPHDYNPIEPELTGITGLRILQATSAIDTGKVIVILDTCHGRLFDSQDHSIGFTNLVNLILNPKYGGVVMSSVHGKQISFEEPYNGLFTRRLVEGIKGAAGHAGEVTIDSLALYVSRRVRQQTIDQQIPTTSKPGLTPDFVVAKKVN